MKYSKTSHLHKYSSPSCAKTSLYGALYYCDHFFFSDYQSPPVSILVYMLLIIGGWDRAYWLESVWQPMPKSQLSWVRSQHPTTQWNLRGANEAILLNKVLKKIPLLSCSFTLLTQSKMYFSCFNVIVVLCDRPFLLPFFCLYILCLTHKYYTYLPSKYSCYLNEMYKFAWFLHYRGWRVGS